jgi:uncharacterized phiE125 gp8 family phage protein
MLTKFQDATVEPLTVADAKVHLRITDAAEDLYLGALISAARLEAENRLQRTFIDTAWRVTLDAFPEAIELPMPPVLTVTELRYIDVAGNAQVVDPGAYTLDNVREPGWLVPAFGGAWPSARDQINGVRVTYRAGYLATGTAAEMRAAVPMPIRQWMLLCIGQMYELRERTVTGVVVNEVKFADALLDTYRVITL